jgi:hypothetical protein
MQVARSSKDPRRGEDESGKIKDTEGGWFWWWVDDGGVDQISAATA